MLFHPIAAAYIRHRSQRTKLGTGGCGSSNLILLSIIDLRLSVVDRAAATSFGADKVELVIRDKCLPLEICPLEPCLRESTTSVTSRMLIELNPI